MVISTGTFGVTEIPHLMQGDSIVLMEEDMKKKAIASLVLALTAGLFLSSCTPPPPSYSERKLSSGRVVKSVSIGKIAFSGGDSALMLKYYTDVDMSDSAALQLEAEDIWKDFQPEVDKAGLKGAILSANSMPHGFISQTSMFNFVFEKQPTGQWLLHKDEKSKAAKEDSQATQ